MNSHDLTLKDLLQAVSTEPDLHRVVHQFFDLSEDRSFFDACKPGKNKDLCQIVAIGLKRKLGIDTAGLDLLFHHYPRLDFFHGGGMVDGHFVQCFYFRREKRGCITVAPPAGDVHHLRIKAVEAPFSKNPEQN